MSEENDFAQLAAQHGGTGAAIILALWKVWDRVSVIPALRELKRNQETMKDAFADMKADLAFIKGRFKQADED